MESKGYNISFIGADLIVAIAMIRNPTKKMIKFPQLEIGLGIYVNLPETTSNQSIERLKSVEADVYQELTHNRKFMDTVMPGTTFRFGSSYKRTFNQTLVLATHFPSSYRLTVIVMIREADNSTLPMLDLGTKIHEYMYTHQHTDLVTQIHMADPQHTTGGLP